VNLPASFEGRERARLFCALRLSDAAIDVLSAWQAANLRDGRIVPPEHLHVTLAFLGHRPVGELPQIVTALRETAAAAEPIRFVPERYRESRTVAMLVLKDLTSAATELANTLFDRLEQAGVYEREARPWLPHVTVLRFRRPPKLKPPLPELAEFAPSDAAAYVSQLGPKGARYFVIESFVLGERVR
jgi:RNA 2',3'-cyclic 3'-phosphodiesterase